MPFPADPLLPDRELRLLELLALVDLDLADFDLLGRDRFDEPGRVEVERFFA